MERDIPKSVRRWMSQIGRKGGAIGGRRRAERQTPEERKALSELANAAKARKQAERKAQAELEAEAPETPHG